MVALFATACVGSSTPGTGSTTPPTGGTAGPATTSPGTAGEAPGTAPSTDGSSSPTTPAPSSPPPASTPIDAVVDGRPAGLEPTVVSGDATDVRVGGFAGGSAVAVEARPSDWSPDDLVADGSGTVDLEVPTSELRPGVTSILLHGSTATGTAVARQVRLRVPGTPSEGIYVTRLCCLDGGGATEAAVTWLGEPLTTVRADAEGGVLVGVPILDLPDDVDQVILVEDPRTGQVLREVVE